MEEAPVVPSSTWRYEKINGVSVVSVPPMDLRCYETQAATNKTPQANAVNAIYFMPQANGIIYPQGIMVSEGKVIGQYDKANQQPHGKPCGTLIVYKDGRVDCKPLLTINGEKDVWFAVSGCSVLPTIRMTEEGFTGIYSDIGRSTSRPLIGYNPTENMVKIAVSDNCTIQKGQDILKSLGCTMGITLDAGGSTMLKVNGEYLWKGDGRKLFGVVGW